MDEPGQNPLQRPMRVALFGLLISVISIGILVPMYFAGNWNYNISPLDENQSLLSRQSWHLTSYWTEEGAVPVINKTDVIIAFDTDRKVSGSSGCNIYFGDYDLSGDTLQIHQIESTQMTSTSEVLNQEKIFFSLLLKTKTYTIQNEHYLMLFDESGNSILTFTSQSQPIQGKEWNLWYPQNDTEGYSFEQTKLQFLDGNRLKGSIGLNKYCGTYELQDNFIQFKSIEICPKPPTSRDEIIEFDEWYLSLLERAHGYSITGSQLDILNDDGHSILSFTKMPLSLIMTDWYPQQYQAVNGSGLLPLAETYDLVNFMPDGKVIGTIQEIPFSAQYDVDNSSISFGPFAMLITEDKDPRKMDESRRVIKSIFGEARTYQVHNGVLKMFSSDGETLMIMTKTDMSSFSRQNISHQYPIEILSS